MILGIDLGTTNSLVGLWSEEGPQLIPNALGHFLTPSAVSLDDSDRILVGLAAQERLAAHPDRTAASFKRAMGTNQEFRLGGRVFRAEELSSFVLRSLKTDAEAALGQTLTEAVITVPAYFNDAQRTATKIAAEYAGLKVERLLNEPTAAALAYGLLEREEGTIAVIDLGGGTFDVSVLDRFEGIVEVRATAGDNFLGGDDFVTAIAEAFLKEVPGSGAAIQDRNFVGLLRREAERAKRELSASDEARMTLPLQGRDVGWTLTRERFEMLSEPLLARLRAPIERALRDAQMRPEGIGHVVLAGGASRMPMFRRMIARLFQRLPVHHLNPDEVVARGAAVQAGLRMRDAALDEVVLTDVAPFTLGVDTAERDAGGRIVASGIFSPIIERNTVIPVSRSKLFFTLQDGQEIIKVGIFQGEARRVSENLRLGELTLFVPRNGAGKEAVELRFTYDMDGLLEVEGTVLSTGRKEHIVIEGHPGALSPAEIEARLAKLAAMKIHPRDQAENQLLLARAERLFQQMLGSDREAIGAVISAWLGVLERQDRREIAEARERLAAYLATLDRGLLL